MQKEKADETAIQLAKAIIQVHHNYVLSQNGDNEQVADDVVSLIESLSERLQRSTLN